MNQMEFGALTDIIKEYYPREKLFATNSSLDLWFDALNDIPYPVALTAVKKWAMTHNFAPTIADIRTGSMDATHVELDNWGDKFAKVLRLVSAFGRNQKELAYAKLDELTIRTVERMGWENLCNSSTENLSTDRANFRNLYMEEKQKMELMAQTKEEVNKNVDFLREKNGNINILQELERRGRLDSTLEKLNGRTTPLIGETH